MDIVLGELYAASFPTTGVDGAHGCVREDHTLSHGGWPSLVDWELGLPLNY